jgi:hypothetical protein
MTTFSASLTNLTPLLHQSRDNSCYVSRPILETPPLWLQKHPDLRAQEFAHFPELWQQPRLADIPCICSWRLCETDLIIRLYTCVLSLWISNTERHHMFCTNKYLRRAISALPHQLYSTEESFSSIALLLVGRLMNCGSNPYMDKSYPFCRFLPDSRTQTSHFSVCTEGHLTGR